MNWLTKWHEAFGTEQNSGLECLLVASVVAIKANGGIQWPVCNSTE